jgi:hypothetical protein
LSIISVNRPDPFALSLLSPGPSTMYILFHFQCSLNPIGSLLSFEYIFVLASQRTK